LDLDFTSGKNVLGSGLDSHPTNRVIKVSAISAGHFNLNEVKPMPHDYKPPNSHRVMQGDILFGRASGSLDLLGATAVVDEVCENIYLPDKVWRLEVPTSGSVIPEFVLGVLRSPDFRAFVRHNASGAAGVRNIGKAKVLSYLAPLPSMDQQRSFATFMEHLRVQSARASASARMIDLLLHSLQSRAFTEGL
jgi:type I restriction enzyme S subunit